MSKSWQGWVVGCAAALVLMGRCHAEETTAKAQTAGERSTPSYIQAQRAAATGDDDPFVPNPDFRGFELPEGPTRPGNHRLVTAKDEAGDDAVAKVHVEVADYFVLLMPSGRLHALPQAKTVKTDKPFTPWTKTQLGKHLTQTAFKGFKTRETARYIYVYDCSDVFAKGASAIMETMYPGLTAYLKRSKLDVHDPEVPMPVVMFRSEKDFQAYREMPPGVVAYYDTITNTVVMYEQSDLGDMAPELAVKQAISTIAHEGVHQILHNVGVQQRLSRWPMWISEGLPEYFSPTEVKASRWKGVGQPNDMRMYELGKYFESKGGSSWKGETIEHTVQAPRLTSTGYASAWGLVHYLAKQKEKEFFAYLRTMSELSPLEGQGNLAALGQRPPDNLSVFKSHFGEDLPKMEEMMVKHLKRLPYVDPIANQTHYVVRLQTDNLERLYITTSPAAIHRIRQQMLEEIGPAAMARTRVLMHAFPNRATAEAAASR